MQETPPCVWGRLALGAAASGAKGNTPTCVGKTRHAASLSSSVKKHPHVCGEDEILTIPKPTRQETPPRVWGRPFFNLPIATLNRNTPTCVGKTPNQTEPASSLEKHPHVCGEDVSDDGKFVLVSETPPRVWGRPAKSV